MSEYSQQVIEHFKIQNEVALDLLGIAQRLCPGTWVLQVMMNFDYVKDKNPKKVYLVCVTNGDDNVTTTNENLGAALAQLIYYLLNGSVFPLTGRGGMYLFPGDDGWIREPEKPTERP